MTELAEGLGPPRGNTPPTPSWAAEDVRAFLLAYGRSPENVTVQQLPSWWANIVLQVGADRERLVLRRYGVTPPEEVRWELAVLDHLQKHGFPTFAPLSRSDAADDRLADFLGRPAILYPFIDGQRGCEIDWSLALAETADVVARLHALTQGIAVPHPRVRSGTESRRIIRQLLNLTAQDGVAPHASILSDFVERARQAIEDFETRLEPYVEALPHGVVHHDAHCENVLFSGDRLVALIDFDDAYEGYLVADLAVMIANWANDGSSLDLEKALTVVRHYERHRQLTAPERNLLPHAVLLFLLGDAAEYIRGRLEAGADGDTAVNDCSRYKCYLHHAHNDEWVARFRSELAKSSN
jgi:homoserine kinase type II